MLDGVEFGNEIVALVRGYVDREIAPLKAENSDLRERLKALEGRPVPDKGEAGERGADGVSPEPEAIAAALLPIAEDLIADSIAKAVAALPPPERGEKGEAGERGEKGERGNDGVDGKNGAGIVDGFLNREGHLVATLSDGTTKDFGEVIGKDGRDGEPGAAGRDGFGFDDMDVNVLDDDRTIEIGFRRGEEEKTFTLKWPTAIYRGVYRDGEQYERGDMTTWGGSLWHCDQPTKDKPGTDSWTLVAKKGRDGKDAKVG